jgi:hypothetical protein
VYIPTPEVLFLRKDMDQAYIKGLRDAKALFDDGILTQEELMREKELLLRKRDEREARASSRPTLHLHQPPLQAPSDTGIGGRLEKETIGEEPRQILMLAPLLQTYDCQENDTPRTIDKKVEPSDKAVLKHNKSVCPGFSCQFALQEEHNPCICLCLPPSRPQHRFECALLVERCPNRLAYVLYILI